MFSSSTNYSTCILHVVLNVQTKNCTTHFFKKKCLGVDEKKVSTTKSTPDNWGNVLQFGYHLAVSVCFSCYP